MTQLRHARGTIRLRLELNAGADGEKTWCDALAKLKAYLAEQHLDNVELVQTSHRSFGKFRQVIAPGLV